MELMSGQSVIIKKLCESVINSEKVMLNMRFTFYKMTHRDTFGQSMMPPRGTGFELLNKSLLQDTVDKIGNNILKQANRLHVNIEKVLEKACEAIKQNYFKYIDD